MDPISMAGALLKLIPSVWEQLQKEYELDSTVKKEFDELKLLIEDLRGFLEEAYSKEVIDSQLKIDILKMRELIYSSEDAIDDLLDSKSRGKWEGLAPEIRHHCNNRTFTAASEAIKCKFLSYTKYRNGMTSLYARNQLPINHVHSSLVGHRSSSVIFSEKKKLVGIKEPMDRLVQWLTDNPSTSKVIFVHGAQGVGKSSLVGAVLRKEIVKRHFNYCVWIKDLRYSELCKDSAEALMKAKAKMWDLTSRDNQGKEVELEVAFRDMKKNKYGWALVLDDLGSGCVFDSESLRSHLDQTRPSVLVTTRVSSLEDRLKFFFEAFSDSQGARLCDAPPESPRSLLSFHFFNRIIAFFTGWALPEPPKKSYDFHGYKHVFLSTEDSEALFCQKMFAGGRCPPHLEKAYGSILEKSERLPLAILATCDLLRGYQCRKNVPPNSAELEQLSGRLGKELISNGGTDDSIRRMITLHRGYHPNVRACLFYLSIFPLDCPIRCSTMMRLWMAERHIMQEPVSEKAEETLKMLLEHNVICENKKTSYGRVNTCRVHNLLHQIIISKSNVEEMAMIVANPTETLPNEVRHLSFHCDMISDYDGTGFQQLRSLLVFQKVNPKSMKKLLGQAKRLKVLDLQRHLVKKEGNNFPAFLNSFPGEILNSKYLRYLSLRDTIINRIDGIGGLAYLETLDLKGTKVSELPYDILELKLLRHLLVYRSNKSPAASSNPQFGVKAPSAIGVLTSLQKLCMIELNSIERSILKEKQWKREQLLEELGKLVNLRSLGISMLRSEDVGLLCSSIEKLKNLVALHLIAADKKILDLSNGDERRELTCFQHVQRVHLTGSLRTWPAWILSPTNLVKLVLKGSQLNQDQFRRLGELQSLKHMELQQAFNDISEVRFGAGVFQQLCFLGLDTFDNLTSINVEEGALPALERLFLGRCKSLTAVPQVITSPRQLKYLVIYDMPWQFTNAVKTNEVRQRLNVKTKAWKVGAIEDVLGPLTNRPKRQGHFKLKKQFP